MPGAYFSKQSPFQEEKPQGALRLVGVPANGSVSSGVPKRAHRLKQECTRVVRQKGLEPPTYCLEGSCSIRMSYWRLWSE